MAPLFICLTTLQGIIRPKLKKQKQIEKQIDVSSLGTVKFNIYTIEVITISCCAVIFLEKNVFATWFLL